MDFTLATYRQLIQSLQNADFSFISFHEYIESYGDSEITGSEAISDEKPFSNLTRSKVELQQTRPPKNPEIQQFSNKTPEPQSSFVILRHDVDLLPQNSLAFARIQHEMGIRGSYYFRVVPKNWDEGIINEIHKLGHEVGYHYEDVDLVQGSGFSVKRSLSSLQNNPAIQTALKSRQGHETMKSLNNEALIDTAIISFQKNLEKLRQLVPVTTICMHGSPRSKYDNRDLWEKYDYRDFGIIGEPYFDIDFNDVLYLTDTGRRWDGWKVSLRDKVPQQEAWVRQGLVFQSTQDIIYALEAGRTTTGTIMPGNILFTFHPQRWHNSPGPWLKELVLQNTKNIVKYFLVNS